MLKYIIKRLIVMIPVVLFISIVGFVSANITSDPVTAYFSGMDKRTGRSLPRKRSSRLKRLWGLISP